MEAFMAYCKNCGQVIDDKAVICPKCGVQQQTIVASDDTGSFGWGLPAMPDSRANMSRS